MQPSDPSPRIRQPFELEPRDPAAFEGCGKPAVIGCLAVLVLLGVGLLVLLPRAPDLFRWTLTKYQEELVRNLPEDLTAEERSRLDAAFEAVVDRVAAGEVDPDALQRLQGALSKTSRRLQDLDRAAVLELIESLESVAGIGEAPAEEAPPEEPGAAASELTAATTSAARLSA